MTSETSSQSQITLYRGWKDTGKYVWSPFVTKIELRFRIEGIKYYTEAGSPSKAPRGKIPYIEFSDPDTKMATVLSDSTLIISDLVKDSRLEDLNARLSPERKAYDLALRALLEDKLYFYHTYERFVQNYYTMRDHILEAFSYPLRLIIGQLIYRSHTSTLHGQGTGRFSPAEIAAFRLQIWESFNDLLLSSKRNSKSSSEPFWVLGDDEPTEADMVLFGFIVSVMYCTAAPDSQKTIREFPVLLEYAGKIHEKFFPDYERWDDRGSCHLNETS